VKADARPPYVHRDAQRGTPPTRRLASRRRARLAELLPWKEPAPPSRPAPSPEGVRERDPGKETPRELRNLAVARSSCPPSPCTYVDRGCRPRCSSSLARSAHFVRSARRDFNPVTKTPAPSRWAPLPLSWSRELPSPSNPCSSVRFAHYAHPRPLSDFFRPCSWPARLFIVGLLQGALGPARPLRR
jgi:hypothetical protein